jgi:kynurenine formamidase
LTRPPVPAGRGSPGDADVRVGGLPTYAQLLARTDAPPGSAWGLFGADDQIGTLNLLTPERAAAGAQAVRTGRAYSLDLALDAFSPPLAPTRHTHTHFIFQRNPHHRDEWVNHLYTQISSQIDGLRHIGHPEHGFYNGADPTRFVPGDDLLGVQHLAEHTIAGRAVLVDVGRYCQAVDEPIDHRAGQPIPIEVVEAARRHQGVDIEPGDILLLRFGWIEWYREQATEDDRRRVATEQHHPGLLQDHATVEWLWDQQISLAAADNFALECWPPQPASPFFTRAERDHGTRDAHSGIMHRVLIPLLGMPIGELWNLDALAADCAADGRYTCLLTAAPLRLTGGVGSPANAVAIR